MIFLVIVGVQKVVKTSVENYIIAESRLESIFVKMKYEIFHTIVFP